MVSANKRTVDDVSKEYDEQRKQWQTLNDRSNFLHKESQNKQEELRKRENALRDLRERHINLQNKFEHKSRLQLSYNDLQSTIQLLDSEIKELEKKV